MLSVLLIQLRTAAWAVREVVAVRRQLRTRPLQEVTVRPSPGTGRGGRALRLVLAGTRSTCLPRALLEQRRDFDGGRSRDLVIGVRKADGEVTAHAWLDPGEMAPEFVELHRLPSERLTPRAAGARWSRGRAAPP